MQNWLRYKYICYSLRNILEKEKSPFEICQHCLHYWRGSMLRSLGVPAGGNMKFRSTSLMCSSGRTMSTSGRGALWEHGFAPSSRLCSAGFASVPLLRRRRRGCVVLCRQYSRSFHMQVIHLEGRLQETQGFLQTARADLQRSEDQLQRALEMEVSHWNASTNVLALFMIKGGREGPGPGTPRGHCICICLEDVLPGQQVLFRWVAIHPWNPIIFVIQVIIPGCGLELHLVGLHHTDEPPNGHCVTKVGVTIWSMINTDHIWSTAFHSYDQHFSYIINSPS